jgi:hypothetical protein
MDTKFYHLYTDIDISQAKNFLQSANISEGHLDLAGARPPFAPPPLATGLPLRGFPLGSVDANRMNDNDSVYRRTRSVRLILDYIDSTRLQTCTIMVSAVSHNSVLVCQFSSVLSCSQTALFVLQFGGWLFVKYSAARTVQFTICRPALPVRLHYPRFPTQHNILFLLSY